MLGLELSEANNDALGYKLAAIYDNALSLELVYELGEV